MIFLKKKKKKNVLKSTLQGLGVWLLAVWGPPEPVQMWGGYAGPPAYSYSLRRQN